MKVRLTTTISGTRNGQDWPPAGTVVEIPDSEAVDLLRVGLAAPVAADPAPVETATRPEVNVQTATPTRGPKSAA